MATEHPGITHCPPHRPESNLLEPPTLEYTIRDFTKKWLPRFAAHSKVLDSAEAHCFEREDSDFHTLKLYSDTLDLLAEFDTEACSNNFTARSYGLSRPTFQIVIDTPLGLRNVAALDNPFTQAEAMREFVDCALDVWEEIKDEGFPGFETIGGEKSFTRFRGDVNGVLRKRQEIRKAEEKIGQKKVKREDKTKAKRKMKKAGLEHGDDDEDMLDG